MNCPNCRQPAITNAVFCGCCGTHLAGSRQTFGVRRAGSGSAESKAPESAAFGPVVSGGDASGSGSAPGGDFASGPGSAHPPGSAQTSHVSEVALASFVARLKGILLAPRAEWPVIATQNTDPASLFTGYAIPLAVLAALVNLIRMSVIGVSLPFGGTLRSPLSAGLTNAVFTCVMAVVGVALVASIINLLAPTFGGTRDSRRALQASAYSLTAAYVGTFLGLLPLGGLLSFLAGLYGIYTLYLGLPVMMRSRPDKAVGYTASVVVCTILVGVLLGAVAASFGIGRAPGLGAFSRSADREAQREQAAATVGNAIGGFLGSDEKGKEGISAAITNLAKAGEQIEQQEKLGAAGAPRSDASGSEAQSAASSQPTDPTQAMAAAGGLLSALGGALGGKHPHTPVDFHQLEGLLPASLPGMTRQQASGAANQALGVRKTSATGIYRGAGNARAQVQIADDTGVSGLMNVAESMDVNEATESDAAFEKDVSLGGRKVHEKYDRGAHHGEVSTIVAHRFEVQVTGDDISMEDLERSLAAIDLGALESMRDAGAVSQ